MPDWKKYVRDHLPSLGLSAGREAEIIEELAQQLEDHYEAVRTSGSSEDEAWERAIRQVPDWEALSENLREAQQPIRTRVDSLAANHSLTQASRLNRLFRMAILQWFWHDIRSIQTNSG